MPARDARAFARAKRLYVVTAGDRVAIHTNRAEALRDARALAVFPEDVMLRCYGVAGAILFAQRVWAGGVIDRYGTLVGGPKGQR